MENWTVESLNQQLDELFAKFDVDRNKKLDKKEYKKVLQALDLKLTDTEIEAMMQIADKNRDGFIDPEEFHEHFYYLIKVMRKNMALHNIEQVA